MKGIIIVILCGIIVAVVQLMIEYGWFANDDGQQTIVIVSNQGVTGIELNSVSTSISFILLFM